MNTLRKICSAIVILAMLVGFLPVGVQPAMAATNVQYIDADGTTKTCASATEVTSSSEAVTWNAGWYVVNSNVPISSRITVSGDVNLILGNGATLTASAGITVSQGNSLTIYAQSTGDNKGALVAGVIGTIADNHAGIGGGNIGSGTVTINGGTVTATGGNDGAGIGGGNTGSGGTVTINGGVVTAQGSDNGAGIGGGNTGSGGTVIINGGSVEATGGSDSSNSSGGAGIGGGTSAAGGTITISGGTVTATGGSNGAGIGGGLDRAGGNVSIMGGTVTATGKGYGEGIGASYTPDALSISHGSCSIGEDAVVFADADSDRSPIGNTSGSNNWNGIVFQGNSGRVYGDVTLEDNLTIPSGSTLTVPDGSTLTIPEGVTVTNNGTITNSGTIEEYGQISGNGVSNSGGTVSVPATVEVSASPNPATYGTTITLTATVTNGNGTNATDGSVSFYQGTASGTSLGSDTVTSDSNGQAAITVAITDTNGFTTGSNTITAVYSGGTGLLGNSGTAALTVNAAPLATPTNPSLTSNSEGTATANWGAVANASGYSVQLYKDGQTSGSAVTVSSGTAHTFDISAAGSYTFTVTATGSGGYSNSSAATSSALTFYTVTFVNGQDTVDTQYVASGNTATLPSTSPAPPNDTQYFAGWVSDGSAFTESTTITGDTTVSASFTDKTSQTATAPTWNSSTTNSITINTVSGQRYAITESNAAPQIGDSGWTEAAASDGTHTFSNLSAAGATYYIWTYLPGGEQTLDSDVVSLTAYTAPSITTNSLSAATVGGSYSMQLEATAADSNTVTWSAEGLPNGLTLDSSTGIIGGTPTTANTTGTTVTITATITGTQVSSSQQFNLVVNAGTMTGSVTISGDAIFDETLTANYTGNADSVSHQWYRDNAEISGATGSTYTLMEADIGHTISVTATSADSNYTGSVTSSTTGTVAKAVGSVTITSNLDKTYDGEPVNEPEYTSVGGAVSFTWYDEVGTQLSTAPSAAGQYSVTATVAETSTHTSASDTMTFSITKQAQDAPAEGVGYSINYAAETITVTDDTYELSATNGEGATGSERLSLTPGTDVYIRLKATTTHDASAWTTVDIPARPSAPQNVRGGTNSITNVDSTMAYSADGETWTAITGERVTNLRAGNYLVRLQATNSAFASESASVTVRDYVAPPTTPSEPEKPSGPSTGDSDGWTSITDELDKLNPDTQEEPLTIEMNGETEVPKEVFETIAGKDVDVVFDMGDGVKWEVNGADIPADADLSNLDLGVSMNTSGIPVEVINAITGEATSVQITLAHDGDFGFALTLSAPLGEENAGYWANLYHYNEAAEAMDFETAALIDDDGTANLRMTHASQYAIVIDDHPHDTVLPFTDVNANDWFYDPVVWAYGQGLMTGTSATNFEPNTSTTRAMIVAILNRLEGGPTASGETFSDVHNGDWYAEAVNWAASVGIVAGFEDGTFRPNAPITREQMAAILYNYAQWKGMDVSNRADLSRYNDQPSPWATDVMQWAVAEGLISGTSATTLDPQGSATRAQVSAILQRFLAG